MLIGNVITSARMQLRLFSCGNCGMEKLPVYHSFSQQNTAFYCTTLLQQRNVLWQPNVHDALYNTDTNPNFTHTKPNQPTAACRLYKMEAEEREDWFSFIFVGGNSPLTTRLRWRWRMCISDTFTAFFLILMWSLCVCVISRISFLWFYYPHAPHGSVLQFYVIVTIFFRSFVNTLHLFIIT